jgi:hypothetical protein
MKLQARLGRAAGVRRTLGDLIERLEELGVDPADETLRLRDPLSSLVS